MRIFPNIIPLWVHPISSCFWVAETCNRKNDGASKFMRWGRQLKYRNTSSVIPMYSTAIYIAMAERNTAMTGAKVTILRCVFHFVLVQ